MSTYSLTWDLDRFFNGGSESTEFKAYLNELAQNLDVLNAQLDSLKVVTELPAVITTIQRVMNQVREASAFISCLQAQDVKDKKAGELRGKTTSLSAEFQAALGKFDQFLLSVDETDWNTFLNQEDQQSLRFILQERKERAAEKLSVEQESLILGLGVDGYHGWSEMYDTITGKISIPFEEDGEVKQLSIGQAANKFSNPDRNVRKTVFENWEKAWEQDGDLISQTLNHLAGFRLTTYKNRGWDEVLKEPLFINRMKQETLDTMWNVIEKYKPVFAEYLQKKASLLGLEKLSWYDLDAPLASSTSTVSYQEGAEFILENFAKFGPKMADFSRKAFEDRWIEAEDRNGKRPGGFCTSFPEKAESRIFMTYSGTASNISTLAHELGHAFHQHVMNDLEPLNQRYAMNVAETASTFAEMIVADAAVKNATSEEEKLALLEDKVQRSVALYMNIHSRFLFETSFYEERKQGMVSQSRLNELMETAQKTAYLDSLDTYHPTFWASKLHFHITGVPFYNFPYTFGYLFSLGIYAKALEEGQGFEEKYIALLRDTGRMTVEDLAEKHLGVDLTQPEFWEKALLLSVQDVHDFLEMTK
ncbi:pepF/M3 family oligoendopeptidase [Bacillus mesophilus]|uniref:M3 family oligoendopeptidase n=1 Tax=Bacillus mesophilus TaxID=1808955 RepID=A0A6M0Q878_9BACI|nr:pepF/M3 family oligoendopeptidase [Bacillus mesophilus]NEY71710.1 M3 family oligoendopeptidase [Bacillus mesophilus]